MIKVLIPPPHIKVGLIKNFMKALDKDSATFNHFPNLFPGLSATRLKEGTFIGPQIREIQKNTIFEELLPSKELRTWEAFKSVLSDFLGCTRVTNYNTCIKTFLRT